MAYWVARLLNSGASPVAMFAKPISSPPCDGLAGVTPAVSPPWPVVTATQVYMSSFELSPPVCCHIWKKRCTGSPVRLPSGLAALSAYGAYLVFWNGPLGKVAGTRGSGTPPCACNCELSTPISSGCGRLAYAAPRVGLIV